MHPDPRTMPHAGMQFSYPTFSSGRQIMLHYSDQTSFWSFLRPFSTGVWLLMFGCAVAVGLIVLLLEGAWSGRNGEARRRFIWDAQR